MRATVDNRDWHGRELIFTGATLTTMPDANEPRLTVDSSYVPGCLGRIVELHSTYYHANWGFGCFFETQVADGLVEFLNRYDAERDGLWTVSIAGRVEGAIAIDGFNTATHGAHLRWFITSEVLRGRGVGTRLIDTALQFCVAKGYAKIYLHTFDGLHAARHLYEKAGFTLVEEQRGSGWGTAVTEQRFEWCGQG